MTIFSILKVDDEYSLKQYPWSDRGLIHRLFQRSSPVLPLLHRMEYQYFLLRHRYFKSQYLIISAQVQLCTSFASFNTSRSRFPTETQLKWAIMKIVGASTSGGASDTKQLSLLLLNKKTHVFERAWIVARKGANRPIFEGETPPKKMYPQYWRWYRRHNRNPVKLVACF
jgi:hypothetical protein